MQLLPRTILARSIVLAFATFPALLQSAAAVETFEQPPVFRAANILTPELLSGPNHRVESLVNNDGLMNLYRISSQFGALGAESTAELVKRIGELNAIAVLKKMQGSKEFADAIVKKGSNVVDGAVNLVTEPVGTISGALSGVGAMFQRAGSSLTGAPRSQYEDNTVEALVGLSAKKREFAAKLGVDVYSSNPLLQEALNAVASAAAAGNLTASVGLAAVGGGAGTAVSVTGGAESLNEYLREKPPTDLRDLNVAKLTKMGVGEGVADLFMSNTVFSPTYQTLLVDALDRMPGVADREAFVKGAVHTESDDLAMFRQRQARMYAAYHAQVGKLERMVSLGGIAAAHTADGKLVVLLPLDYVAWTAGVANTVGSISAAVAKADAAAPREVWLGGDASPAALKALQAAGWKVQLNQMASLVGPG